VVRQRRIDLAGRGWRGSHAQAKGCCGSGFYQATTADWLHLVLLVTRRVGAATCRNARRTDPGVLQDDLGQQPHQRAVGAKLGFARLQERLGDRGAAVLDLADVLHRVVDAVRERLQRQILSLATRRSSAPQPGGARLRGQAAWAAGRDGAPPTGRDSGKRSSRAIAFTGQAPQLAVTATSAAYAPASPTLAPATCSSTAGAEAGR
jgi:hypothetical protein